MAAEGVANRSPDPRFNQPHTEDRQCDVKTNRIGKLSLNVSAASSDQIYQETETKNQTWGLGTMPAENRFLRGAFALAAAGP